MPDNEAHRSRGAGSVGKPVLPLEQAIPYLGAPPVAKDEYVRVDLDLWNALRELYLPVGPVDRGWVREIAIYAVTTSEGIVQAIATLIVVSRSQALERVLAQLELGPDSTADIPELPLRFASMKRECRLAGSPAATVDYRKWSFASAAISVKSGKSNPRSRARRFWKGAAIEPFAVCSGTVPDVSSAGYQFSKSRTPCDQSDPAENKADSQPEQHRSKNCRRQDAVDGQCAPAGLAIPIWSDGCCRRPLKHSRNTLRAVRPVAKSESGAQSR